MHVFGLSDSADIQPGEWVRLPHWYGTVGTIPRPWHIADNARTLLCGIPITTAELEHQADEPAGGIKCAACISTRNRRVPRFGVGQHVRVARVLDEITSPRLEGMHGVIEDIDAVGGGQFNYDVWLLETDGSHYLNEQMLEPTDD